MVELNIDSFTVPSSIITPKQIFDSDDESEISTSRDFGAISISKNSIELKNNEFYKEDPKSLSINLNSGFKEMVCSSIASHNRHSSNPLTPNSYTEIPQSNPIFVNYALNVEQTAKSPFQSYGIPPSPQKFVPSSPLPIKFNSSGSLNGTRRHTHTSLSSIIPGSPLIKSLVSPSCRINNNPSSPPPAHINQQISSSAPKSSLALFRSVSVDNSNPPPPLGTKKSSVNITLNKFRRMSEDEQFENDEKIVLFYDILF